MTQRGRAIQRWRSTDEGNDKLLKTRLHGPFGERSIGRFSKKLVSVGSPSTETGCHVSVHPEDAALRGRIKGTKTKVL
jgi:hypothetical protein